MITGFNTDVKHNAKVYHVQTEDKGRNNPKIESLVYVGGEILDNYRTSYEQDKATLTEDDIMELLESQHKRVIRSIKVGKYDESAPFEEGLITDRSLDEVITDYLSQEECPDHMKLVANGIANLFRNKTAVLEIDARRTLSGEPIEGAEVRIKLLAPNHKPLVLGKGATNEEGHLSVETKLPPANISTGALMIQAISEDGAFEQRYPLR